MEQIKVAAQAPLLSTDSVVTRTDPGAGKRGRIPIYSALAPVDGALWLV
jgi:hypothetical protein